MGFVYFLQQASTPAAPAEIPTTVQGAAILALFFVVREVPGMFEKAKAYIDVRIEERKKQMAQLDTIFQELKRRDERIDALEVRADQADTRADQSALRAKAAEDAAQQALLKQSHYEQRVAELETNLRDMNFKLETLMSENTGKDTIILQQTDIIHNLESQKQVIQSQLEEVTKERDFYKGESQRLMFERDQAVTARELAEEKLKTVETGNYPAVSVQPPPDPPILPENPVSSEEA